jgi:hypothetical protein
MTEVAGDTPRSESAPPPAQEFGVEAAAVASTPAPPPAGDEGGDLSAEGAASGSDLRQQFGP